MRVRVPSSLRSFVVRAFLWLPPCFAAWYLLAQYHSAVAGALARALANAIASGVVAAVEREGSALVFVTALGVHPAPGVTADLLVEVNPLLYTYGLALFVALMLAARSRWRATLVGIALLVPFQAWGIAFDFLLQIGIAMGPDISALARFSAWQREAIAIGYQLGSLIFPSLAPVAVWACFNRRFIETALLSRPQVLSA
jgi:hypothetical protein